MEKKQKTKAMIRPRAQKKYLQEKQCVQAKRRNDKLLFKDKFRVKMSLLFLFEKKTKTKTRSSTIFETQAMLSMKSKQ